MAKLYLPVSSRLACATHQDRMNNAVIAVLLHHSAFFCSSVASRRCSRLIVSVLALALIGKLLSSSSSTSSELSLPLLVDLSGISSVSS